MLDIKLNNYCSLLKKKFFQPLLEDMLLLYDMPFTNAEKKPNKYKCNNVL